jgi:hypothetical protein
VAAWHKIYAEGDEVSDQVGYKTAEPSLTALSQFSKYLPFSVPGCYRQKCFAPLWHTDRARDTKRPKF